MQYEMIRAFREASIDEEHVAWELATLLSRIFPSLPSPGTTVEARNADTDSTMLMDPLQIAFDATAGADGALAPDLEQTDLFASLGFDPIAILWGKEGPAGGAELSAGYGFDGDVHL